LILTTNNFEYHPIKLEIMNLLCSYSKDLYNFSLYKIRQHFFKTNSYLSYNDNYKLVKNSLNEFDEKPYYKLPTNVSQQTLKAVDYSFKSFLSLLKQKNSGKYNKKIKLPGYLDKNGKYRVIFTKIHMRFVNNLVRLTLPKEIKDNYKFKSLDFKIPKHIDKDEIQEIHIIPIGKSFKVSWIRKSDNDIEYLHSDNIMSIDLGINNLATILISNSQPIIIDGKKAKSVNSRFNYKIAKLKSQIDRTKNNNKNYSQLSLSLCKTFSNRNNFMKNFIHKTATKIVDIAFKQQINTIIVGYNKEWKTEVNLGRKNNKIFYGIPHSTLIDYITYKAKTMGIKVILQEEAYTSKCDALAFETIEKQDKYLGKRIKRGLFQSSTGKLINADVNAAINILSKYLNKYKQDSYLIVNKILSKGFVFNPVRLRLI